MICTAFSLALVTVIFIWTIRYVNGNSGRYSV